MFEVALEHGVAVEVNGLPIRLDLSGQHVREAVRAGVQIVCSPQSSNVAADSGGLAISTWL